MKKLKIRADKKKGRGVFAADKISKGEVIEDCHLIIVHQKELKGLLEGYVYSYSKKEMALALGNGSLYNHDDEFNAEYSIDRRKKRLRIIAKRQIKPNEEVTINYGYSPKERKKFNIQ